MQMTRFIYILYGLLFLPLWAAGKVFTLTSPDSKLVVTLSNEDQLTYQLSYNGVSLLGESAIGLRLKTGMLGEKARVARQKTRHVGETIVSPNYRVQSFTVDYNELDILFKGNFGIRFRAYNEGIAYRFYTTFRQPLTVVNEVAEFNFDKDYVTYMAYSTAKEKDPMAMAFQNLYTRAKLTETDTGNLAFLPVAVDYGNGLKLTITEADLEAYPGMFIQGDGEQFSLHGVFARYPARMDYRPWRHMTYVAERKGHIAEVEGAREFPWRILAVSDNDAEMPVNNLVYALASPNRIGDYSWVKGGKSAWEWWNDWGITGVDFKAGINTATYKHYIDFASENQIPFIILDEGWYEPKSGDMLSVVPDVDLLGLVKYAEPKQVGIILWAVFNAMDEKLEEICQTYSELGIKGFKVDFLDRDDQTAVEMVYRLAEMTAKYKLTLDLHGLYKPTGLNRTYPHILNFESVFGMEEVKWSTVEKDMMMYDVIMPYLRMMAGPLDYTPGAMRNASKRNFKDIYGGPMSQGTRCHQLATYIVHDSPLTMLADNPTIYRKEQECTDFIVSIPNTGIEETRILDGKLGEFIITARRVGTDWYIGGMTNWDAREISIDLSFLNESNYRATIFRDGINADKQAADYVKEEKILTKKSPLAIRMEPGGGFAISLKR